MSEQELQKIPFDEVSLNAKMSELYEEAIDQYVEEHSTEEAYEDTLNDIYGDVSICGFERPQGTVLKEIDPIAFNVGMSDNEDNVRDQASNEIDEDDFRDDALEALNMLDEDEE